MLKVYGSGQDIIEVEANQHPTHYRFKNIESKGLILAFSDGTLLEALHKLPGIWEIRVLIKGKNKLDRIESLFKGEDCTDEILIHGDIEWVVCCRDYKIRTKNIKCDTTCANSS